MGLFGRSKGSSAPPGPNQIAPVSSAPAARSTADLNDTIFNMKFTSKQLARLSKKTESTLALEKKNCKRAIEKGDAIVARLHAENAVRVEKQALSYLKLQSRLDAVASKLEGHSKMMQVTSTMGDVTVSLNSALQTMDISKISNVMDTFEKQFEDLDMQAQYMDGAISDTTASGTPQSEVNNLLKQVADEHNLAIQGDILGGMIPGKGPEASQAQRASGADDIEERFRKLQGQGPPGP